jgi:hypothetical protein
MLRLDGEDSSAAPPPESRSLLPTISSDDDGRTDDVLELVEQLDMATSTLHEESREADRLCLSVATAKREIAMIELAATKA